MYRELSSEPSKWQRENTVHEDHKDADINIALHLNQGRVKRGPRNHEDKAGTPTHGYRNKKK